MAYDIIFSEKEELPAAGADREPTTVFRAFGDDVLLADLPTNAKVFAFFFPGSSDTDDLQGELRRLGERSGDNLYVDIGSLADADFAAAVKRFKMGPLPSIVVTATGPLAATPDRDSAFVRLDGKALFANPAQLIRTVEELFTLFLAGRISQAVRVGWTRQGTAALSTTAEQVWRSVIQPVVTWLAGREYTLDFFAGTLEVKERGGD